MSSQRVRIGVFDSGIGGLSVLRHLISVLPDVHYLYLGDTARVPYGNKSPDTIALYAAQSASFLRDKGVDMVVVACNTVSATSLPVVEVVAEVPVVGMIEPAVKAALATTVNNRIGVIGTRATVESHAYELALYAHGGQHGLTVVEHASPLLVALAEEGWLAHPATYAIVEEYLRPFEEAQIDTLILGCTHFPLLADVFEQVAPFQLIDPGYWAARQVQQLLGIPDRNRAASHAPSVEYYVTDISSNFAAVARQFLGFEAYPLHRISLEHRVSHTLLKPDANHPV